MNFQDLIDKHNELSDELTKLYCQITSEMDKFRIDEENYINGEIHVRIYWGFEGDWQISGPKGYISGYDPYGGIRVWEQLWLILHDMPVLYDNIVTEVDPYQEY